MSAPPTNELRAFHEFLGTKLHDEGSSCSPEEALDEWRRQHPDAETSDDDLAAINEALDDMVKGDRGIPFDDFDREFRQKYNLPETP